MRVKFDHVFADLGGVPPDRLSDPQGLAGLLLVAANAAGLNPVTPPTVTTGPKGVGVALMCQGGHIVLHASWTRASASRTSRESAARTRNADWT
jgi:S-adenosylmethionine/arginine decarboxylase-like enzyme